MTFQLTLFPDEFLELANILCQSEWIISPFVHNLVLLVAREYQQRQIPPEKFDYVSIPERALFSYSVDNPGETYYRTVREMFDKIADARVIIRHENGDLEQVQFFRGRVYYSQKKKELRVCLNQDLYDFWIDLHALYARLSITDMLSLPNTKYARLMFQLIASFKYLGQKELDFEAFKRIMHCEKMEPGIFKRDVLIPCHRDINETSLKWEYELVRGAHNKIKSIRIWFPDGGVLPQAETKIEEARPMDQESEARPSDEQALIFTYKNRVTVKRINEVTVYIYGYIENCYNWVRSHGGNFTGKQIKFDTKQATDDFIAICEASQIAVTEGEQK